MFRKIIFIIAIVIVGAAIQSCAFEPRIGTDSTVYINSWVKREHPSIYVQPRNSPARPYKAIMIPFTVAQDINNFRSLSVELTRIVWQAWTQLQVFPGLYYEIPPNMQVPQGQYFPGRSYENAPPYHSLDQIIAHGRSQGADLLVSGTFNYIMPAGTQGATSVSYSISVIDLATGEPIWSLAQAGSIDGPEKVDLYVLQSKMRLPSDPLRHIIYTLAQDMGEVVRNWNHNISKGKVFDKVYP